MMYTFVLAFSLSAATLPPHVSDDEWGGCCLTDAYWFGCSFEEAKANYHAGNLFRKAHVTPLYGVNDAAWFAMDGRCDAVRDMWRHLRDALDDQIKPSDRMLALRQLRGLLGDDAYYSGRIHSPVPPAR